MTASFEVYRVSLVLKSIIGKMLHFIYLNCMFLQSSHYHDIWFHILKCNAQYEYLISLFGVAFKQGYRGCTLLITYSLSLRDAQTFCHKNIKVDCINLFLWSKISYKMLLALTSFIFKLTVTGIPAIFLLLLFIVCPAGKSRKLQFSLHHQHYHLLPSIW